MRVIFASAFCLFGVAHGQPIDADTPWDSPNDAPADPVVVQPPLPPVSPATTPVTVGVVTEFCTVAADCFVGTGTFPATDIACVAKQCACSGTYELWENTVCVPVGTTQPPRIAIRLQILWDTIFCADIDQAQMVTEMNALYGGAYGAQTVQGEIKCGSVAYVAKLLGVVATQAATTNALEIFKQAQASGTNNFFSFLPVPSSVDAAAGSSTCAVENAIETAMVFGLCQPAVCAVGYVLQSKFSLTEVDICALDVTTSGLTQISTDDDDLSDGAIVGIVLGSVFFVVIVVVLVMLYVCTRQIKKNKSKNETGSEEAMVRKEKNHAPDADSEDEATSPSKFPVSHPRAPDVE